MQAPFAYIRMQTTYYDTEDGLLEKNRWMLRLRTENERSAVTMKTPGEGHTRGEWEVESEYLDEALPGACKAWRAGGDRPSGRGGAAAGLRGEIHPHHRAAPALGADELHALRRSRRTDRRREEGASVRART